MIAISLRRDSRRARRQERCSATRQSRTPRRRVEPLTPPSLATPLAAIANRRASLLKGVDAAKLADAETARRLKREQEEKREKVPARCLPPSCWVEVLRQSALARRLDALPSVRPPREKLRALRCSQCLHEPPRSTDSLGLPEYSLGRAQLIEQKAAAARAEREAALEKERKAVVERMRMRKALEESQAELGANPVDYAFTDIAPAEDDKGRLESFEETRARMNVWINKNKIKVCAEEGRPIEAWLVLASHPDARPCVHKGPERGNSGGAASVGRDRRVRFRRAQAAREKGRGGGGGGVFSSLGPCVTSLV